MGRTHICLPTNMPTNMTCALIPNTCFTKILKKIWYFIWYVFLASIPYLEDNEREISYKRISENEVEDKDSKHEVAYLRDGKSSREYEDAKDKKTNLKDRYSSYQMWEDKRESPDETGSSSSDGD